MATSLSVLLNDPSFDGQSPDSVRRLTQAVGFQVPDREDMEASLSHGAGAVRLLLSSPKLSEERRQDLASDGLLAWAKKVLDCRDSINIAQALVAAGGNVNALSPSGRTPLTLFAEQLGRVEAEEAALKKVSPGAFESGGAKVLRAAWGLLEAQGAHLEKARALREGACALREGGLKVSQWRSQRVPSSAASPVAKTTWRPPAP